MKLFCPLPALIGKHLKFLNSRIKKQFRLSTRITFVIMFLLRLVLRSELFAFLLITVLGLSFNLNVIQPWEGW